MPGAAETDGLAAAEPGVAGVDEAGRGPLAGPVTVAAVILEPGTAIDGVTDSKKLTPKRRERAAERIRAQARAWALAWAEPEEIDSRNVLQATMAAMQRAVAGLAESPRRVRVDGNRTPEFGVPAEAVVGGDAADAAIAAASILAKVARDDHMEALEATHPGYGFAAHKGYATAAHREALMRLGPCAAHRHSFAPVDAAARQMQLDF